MFKFRLSMIGCHKHKTIRAFFAAIAIVVLLLSLAACKGKHKHTYAEEFSYDAENHWRPATCEHKEEKRDFDAHKLEGGICKTCGYQTISLQVKTNADNQKYVRTQPIHEMLKLGFAYGENQSDIQWVQAQKNNIESYTIADGQITVTVSAVADNIKHTAEIKMPLDESTVDVETFFAKNTGDACMLNGVVAGFSTTGNNNEVVLADKQTGKLVSVIKMGTGKLLHGGYCLPGVEIGDEIVIPVTLVKEKQSETSANSAKVYAEYMGGTDYQAAVVSKNNQIKHATDSVLIESQADLQAFLSAANRENNHYKTVKFKGKMNFVMDATYENYNFWFSEKEVKLRNDVVIDNVAPCFNDPALYYTLGTNFSNLVLGASHQAAIDYKNPHSAEVEITAVYLGGCTSFGQFLILDETWVTK